MSATKSSGAKSTSKRRQEPLSPEKMSKKLKGARKRIRQLENDLGSERAAREALEKRVEALAGTQQTLMFNLRRVFKHLGLSPRQQPAKDEQG